MSSVLNRQRASGSGAQGGGAGYVIENSLRFNGTSSYLHKTFSGAGSTNKMTISMWVKKSTSIASTHYDYIGAFSSGSDELRWDITNLELRSTIGGRLQETVQKFADPTAWYHLVISYDFTQSVEANRYRLFVNGEQVSSFAGSYPTLNDTFGNWLKAEKHVLGSFFAANIATRFFDGYWAEFVLIDGQGLDATSFGEYDSNGNWVPVDPSGLTFGTNGFWLDFATAPGVSNGSGTDVSGNDNHFTEVSFAANDKVSDSPTDDSSTGASNYATLSKIVRPSADNGVISNGGTTSVTNYAVSPFGMTSGKWYVEFTPTSMTTFYAALFKDSTSLAFQFTADGEGRAYDNAGRYWKDGAIISTGHGTVSNDDHVAIAVDLDNLNIEWYINNVSKYEATDLEAGQTWYFTCGTSSTVNANFGTAPVTGGETDENGFGDFEFAPPSGYLALCTANLPAPIKDPTKYFQVDTFTGTAGELARTLTDRSDAAFAPDLIWGTNRTNTGAVHMVGSVRGATKEIESDDYSDEATAAQGVKSFDASGYTLGTDADYNAASANVNWCFKFGGAPTGDNSAGAAATPTAGSVKVDGANHGSAATGSIPVLRGSANTTAAMSAIKWTGTGANGTIDHFLGVVPEFIAVKTLANGSGGNSWRCYHAGVASDAQTDALQLNGLIAAADDSIFWNDTAPTSSVFSVGSSAEVHTSGNPSIAYCFASVENYSKIGAFEGNGNANGTFVHLGFRAAFILVKSADSTSEWDVYDSKRDGYNPDNDALSISTPLAETTANDIDILSNGFKCRIATDPNVAETYVYMAIADYPSGEGVSQARAR